MVEQAVENLSLDDSNLSHFDSMGLSEQPLGHQIDSPEDQSYRIPSSSTGGTRSVLYSTSFPGSFLSSQMGHRDHASRPNRADDAYFNEQKREGSLENRQLSETNPDETTQQRRPEKIRNIFKSVEDYIVTSFGSFEGVNSSFSTLRPSMHPRAISEGNRRNPALRHNERSARSDETLSELDAKTLLLGDFAENGSWWTGGRDARSPERTRSHRSGDPFDDSVTVKSPRINWSDLNEWYNLVLNAGRSWQRTLDDLTVSELHNLPLRLPSEQDMEEMENQIAGAQAHTQRVLLKATESLLKRPGRPLREPEDLRFLLIVLANPLLYPSHTPSVSGSRNRSRSRSRSRDRNSSLRGSQEELMKDSQSHLIADTNANRGSSGQHSGIIKRILGLLSNAPNNSHHYLVSWLARYSDGQFHKIADLIGSFVTYRLTRQHGKKRDVDHDPTAGLIPNLSGPGRGTSSALHAALGATGQQPSKKRAGKPQPVIYNDDWQIKAAARVMSLVFAANNSGLARRGGSRTPAALRAGHSAGLAARERAHHHRQILPTSDFYNTLLDYSNLIADFEAWEAKRGKFAFCQYPFFLSIWAKIQIMEHDARRQMEVKAREAFFDSIMTHKTVNQYLVLKIRRECLVEDSLKGVSEVVGSGGEEIKKGLRIEFKGEEGIDAGGLRKEWFLLLVRDVFNPEHGLSNFYVTYKLPSLIATRHVYL
jgi:E3 ubiquitin-protein ligase HECTD2